MLCERLRPIGVQGLVGRAPTLPIAKICRQRSASIYEKAVESQTVGTFRRPTSLGQRQSFSRAAAERHASGNLESLEISSLRMVLADTDGLWAVDARQETDTWTKADNSL